MEVKVIGKLSNRRSKAAISDLEFAVHDYTRLSEETRKMKELKGLDYAWDQVRTFHKAFGHPAPDIPAPLTEERKAARIAWIAEELQELRDADNLVDQVDANIDIIYLALGNLVEMGTLPQAFQDIVQEANMGKLWEDGKPHLRDDGKIIKPPGWAENHAPEPKIKAEVCRQVLERSPKMRGTLIDLVDPTEGVN